jgi:plasmid stabilization system protein ParE
VKTYTVVFAPEAEDDLVELFEYIAEHGSPVNAERYTEAIVAHCEALTTFPHRGTPRDDIRPGLRTTNYRKRAVIAFEVDDESAMVSILGVYYGGRDFEQALSASEDDPGDAQGDQA